MESAGEGGARDIALLAAFMRQKRDGETLEAYLADRVFAGSAGVCAEPAPPVSVTVAPVTFASPALIALSSSAN
jgi:hypothetical protein